MIRKWYIKVKRGPMCLSDVKGQMGMCIHLGILGQDPLPQTTSTMYGEGPD